MIFDFSRIKIAKSSSLSGGVDSSALFFLLLNHKIDFDIAIVNYNTKKNNQKMKIICFKFSKKYKKDIY